ncbi:hypothetical protein E2C01_042562 [Portunus trituberculatus]|uniref:Uncharacterized protein n=1 Tax=Portunus trituberculatus TaxID=210409 RepID=A0A5B7FV51_PORTR|nr:hypothetical protein [Portunus trituberculatus]
MASRCCPCDKVLTRSLWRRAARSSRRGRPTFEMGGRRGEESCPLLPGTRYAVQHKILKVSVGTKFLDTPLDGRQVMTGRGGHRMPGASRGKATALFPA